MIVDLQPVALRADLDGMIAGRLEAVRERDGLLAARGKVEHLLSAAAAIDQPLDSLAVSRLAAEVFHRGLEGDAAAGHRHGIDRPQAGDGEVLGPRLSQVDHDQRGGLGQGLALAAEILLGRLAEVRRPGGSLQVGEEVDLDLVVSQAGVLAAGPLDHSAHGGHRGRQVGAGVQQIEVVDFVAHGGGLRSRPAHHHLRRRRHQDQREDIARRTLADDPLSQLLGPVEEALLAAAIGHGIRAVDHQHAMRGLAAAEGQAAALQKRHGDHGQHRQHDERASAAPTAAIAPVAAVATAA